MPALTEIYRPATLDDLVGQDAVVAKLRRYVERGIGGRVILFQGPSGVGKTSMAIALAGKRDIGSLIHYKLHVVKSARDLGRMPPLVTLKAQCGPGDNAEPVLTIMLPEDDRSEALQPPRPRGIWP